MHHKNMYKTRPEKSVNSFKMRNKKLVGIFTSRGFNIRLIGEESPKIVLDDKSLLSCTIKDFQLVFFKSFSSNNVLKSFNFKNDVYISDYELGEVIRMCEQQPVFRLQLKRTQLCIVGYNFDEDKELRYPVFAVSVPWLYLTKEDADVERTRLLEEGYEVEVI
jgi:hypothetical protein